LEEAHVDYWKSIKSMTINDEKEVSTILLIYPQFIDSMDIFTSFTDTIDKLFTAIRTADTDELKINDSIDNVYFHPDFRFRDKDGQIIFLFDEEGNVMGTSEDIVSPVSFARRSPWPMINLLRSKQVEKIQSKIPEGQIMKSNIHRLEKIGAEKLQEMLDNRDWSSLPSIPHEDRLQKKIIEVEQSTLTTISNHVERHDDGNINIDDHYIALAEKWISMQ
jgi:hypothetical protein